MLRSSPSMAGEGQEPLNKFVSLLLRVQCGPQQESQHTSLGAWALPALLGGKHISRDSGERAQPL